MKIAFIISSVCDRGGVERIIIDRANYLASEGHEVTIICTAQNKQSGIAYPIDSNINVIVSDMYFCPGCTIISNPIGFFRKYLEYRRMIKSFVNQIICGLQPDIVTMNTYSPVEICSKVPVVVESHSIRGSEYWNPIKEYALRKIVKKADVTVSLTERDALKWKEARRVEVIPNFTNVTPEKICDYSSHKALAIGRLGNQKGFDMLIDAWKIVNRYHQDWILDIFGEGALKQKLQKRISDNQLGHSVRLCGNTNCVEKEFASHSVFVLSSRFEGFALVLIETITCGTPCVAFDCPTGPAEIITNGDNGLLIPYEKLSPKERIEKLAEGIIYMIEHPEERIRLGERGMNSIKQFNRDLIMKRWDDLYSSIITNKDRP